MIDTAFRCRTGFYDLERLCFIEYALILDCLRLDYFAGVVGSRLDELRLDDVVNAYKQRYRLIHLQLIINALLSP